MDANDKGDKTKKSKGGVNEICNNTHLIFTGTLKKGLCETPKIVH
jgi:hypothetical protein